MRMTLPFCRVTAAALLLTAALSARAQSAGGKVHGESIDGSAAAAAPAPTAAAVPVVTTTGGIINAGFDTLASFPFTVPDMTAKTHPTVAEAEKQIPASIKNLDGKTVRVRGFMMPVKELQGKTTEFLITRSQPSCCFSGATEINEFVTVKVPGKGFDTMMDDPITVEGKLHVAAVTDSGFIVGLYVLDGEKIVSP
jgi:hypothetical protein